MSTYYKYVDRDVDQQINWAQMSSGLSKALLDRQADLAKRKAAINKESEELLTKLNNPDLGVNRDVNSLMIDGGVKLSKTLKTANDLFRKNLLSETEFLQIKQETKNSADKFSKFPALFQKESEDAMKGMLEGKYSSATGDVFEIMQDAVTPNKVGIAVDERGKLFLGNKVEKVVDGQTVTTLETDPNKIDDIQNYLTMATTSKINKLDLTKAIEPVFDKTQKFITEQGSINASIRQHGKNVTLDDLTQNKAWVGMMKDYSKGMSENPMVLVSILKDYKGTIDVVVGKDKDGKDIVEKKPFKIVKGTPKADNEIQLIANSNGQTTFKFTEKQKDIGETFLVNHILGKVNIEEKIDSISQLQDVDVRRAELQEKKRQFNKEQEKEDNNSVFAGKVIAKAARPRTIQEGKEAASNIAKLSGYNEGTFDAKDGGRIILRKYGNDPYGRDDEVRVIKIPGKNAESGIEDFGAEIFSENDNLDMGIVQRVARQKVKEYTPNAVQTRVNKATGFGQFNKNKNKNKKNQ